MYNINVLANLKPEDLIEYLRKSRADDPALTVEEVLSNHEAEIDEWVANNFDYPIPECNRYREVVSGESLSERVEFQKVLKLAESPSVKAIIVKEIARIGRPDTMEIGLISKTLRYTNTLVISVKPFMVFDLSVKYQREMFENELKNSQHYLEYVKGILTDGKDRSVKSGNYLGGKALYGYDKIQVVENKKKCPTLAINEDEANIVRTIFNWYVKENIGTSTIAHRLNELGLKSPGGKKWTADPIRRILENIHYIGMVRWNTRKTTLIVDNGEFKKTRPKTGEAIIVKGKHEAIISEELFCAAQEKRGRTHRTCDNKDLRNPLATLLFCECGKAMSYRHSTRGNLNYRPPILVCNGQHLCGNGSVRVDEMMEFVANALKDKIAEFEIEAQNVDNNNINLHEKMISSLEKKLSDLDAQELQMWKRQVGADESKHIPENIFQSMTADLVKEREDTRKALEKAREVAQTPVDYKKKIVTLQKALDALLDDETSVADKNNFMKQCIHRIDYRREAPSRMLGKGVGRQWVMKPAEIDIKWML